MLRSSAAQVSEPHHGVSSADARAAHEHSAARRQQERRRSAGSGWRRVAAAHSSSCHAWCSRTWAGRIGRRCTQSGCPSQGGEGGESERSEAAYIRRNSGKAGAAAACWLLFVWSARRLHHGSMPSRQARPVAPQGPHGGERGGRTRRGNEFNSKPPALARRGGRGPRPELRGRYMYKRWHQIAGKRSLSILGENPDSDMASLTVTI